MKPLLYFLLIIVPGTKALGQLKNPVILKSFTDSFTYSEAGTRKNLPIKNDTSAFGTNYYDNVLKITTGVDSIAVHFDPALKPYRQSTIVHISSPKAKKVVYLHFNETSCWFTNDYLQRAQGNVQYDIPETYELANVLYALTSGSDNNDTRTFKNSPYYKKLQSYFSKFKNHPLIKLIDFADDVKGTMDYYNFRDNSFCYKIEKGKLVPNDQYYVVWGDLNSNLFTKHLALINDFYSKTNFHQFFQRNHSFYDSLIQRQQALMPAGKMWEWLEKNFDKKIQSYRVVFSPLIKGSHGTQIFYWIPKPATFFSEAVMFVSSVRDIDDGTGLTEAQKEGISSGILFTEIDHNYCDPVSLQYKTAIDSSLSHREKWAAKKGDADNYPSPLAVFNEYITHAVYLLYAFDNFKKEDFVLIKKEREKLMVERRKYVKFKEFDEKLLELYKQRSPAQKVKDLFPMIINWCSLIN